MTWCVIGEMMKEILMKRAVVDRVYVVRNCCLVCRGGRGARDWRVVSARKRNIAELLGSIG